MSIEIGDYEKLYGERPTLFVRCPGRVNIIGEHIDYMGYSVFPMAIEQQTQLLAGPNNSNEIRISNIDPAYKEVRIPLPTEWNGAAPPQWYDYFLSGWKGILDNLPGSVPIGFNVLMGGTIPASSGLSSSSSIVCAGALTTLLIQTGEAFDLFTREQLADICASSEHYVGTQGGGMDQAAEILAKEGQALRIDFNPLGSTAIPLPQNAQFVILHCGESLNKAATSQFNQRVAECRLAGKLLLHAASQECDSFRLKDIQCLLGASLQEMLKLSENLPETASRKELDEILGKELVDSCLTGNTKDMTSFILRSRARHVFSEALRVDETNKACLANDIHKMGQLMNQSHQSCSQDYDCSCEALDQLVSACQQSGVLGARLTGAGWGGCVVALVDSQKPTDLSALNVLFSSRPSPGLSYEIL